MGGAGGGGGGGGAGGIHELQRVLRKTPLNEVLTVAERSTRHQGNRLRSVAGSHSASYYASRIGVEISTNIIPLWSLYIIIYLNNPQNNVLISKAPICDFSRVKKVPKSRPKHKPSQAHKRSL